MGDPDQMGGVVRIWACGEIDGAKVVGSRPEVKRVVGPEHPQRGIDRVADFIGIKDVGERAGVTQIQHQLHPQLERATNRRPSAGFSVGDRLQHADRTVVGVAGGEEF
jgi:hypothetical protein